MMMAMKAHFRNSTDYGSAFNQTITYGNNVEQVYSYHSDYFLFYFSEKKIGLA